MATWGAITVPVLWGSYSPQNSDGGITEIKILPDPLTPDVAASVLQQGGRARKRVSLETFVSTIAGYEAWRIDHVSATVRTWTGPLASEAAFSAVVEQLSKPDILAATHIRFGVTLVEAEGGGT